jgi:hypothetical protein
LYSPEGELIRATDWAGEEEDLFPGDFDSSDVLDQLFAKGWYDKMWERIHARGWQPWVGFENDYYVVYDADDEVVEVYDIDGTRHGPEFDIYARDYNKFQTLSGGQLKELYEMQQELELVEQAGVLSMAGSSGSLFREAGL